MFDTNLFGEMDPTYRIALGGCVNSMLIWTAKEMCAVPERPVHKANNLTYVIKTAKHIFDFN